MWHYFPRKIEKRLLRERKKSRGASATMTLIYSPCMHASPLSAGCVTVAMIHSTTTLFCRSVLAFTHKSRFWLPPRRAYFSTSPTETKRVETTVDHKGIARVVLSRPDKLNALDLPMFEAIAEEASSLKKDKSLRAVILSGAGRAFCTGLDVKTMLKNHPKKTMNRLLERPSGYSTTSANANLAQDVGYLWRSLPVPVIASLHGMCFGGGMQIALGADFRFATPDCKLSIMEAKWGLIPDMSASVTLRELVRIDVAKELTMTGRVLSGEEAASLGLVTRCVDDPMAEAETLANEIMQRCVME